MTSALQGVRDRLDGTDKPRPPAVRATVDAMLPAMSRVLAVSDPASSEAELRTLALQEWVRECQDELMHESAVSTELVNPHPIPYPNRQPYPYPHRQPNPNPHPHPTPHPRPSP